MSGPGATPAYQSVIVMTGLTGIRTPQSLRRYAHLTAMVSVSAFHAAAQGEL